MQLVEGFNMDTVTPELCELGMGISREIVLAGEVKHLDGVKIFLQ